MDSPVLVLIITKIDNPLMFTATSLIHSNPRPSCKWHLPTVPTVYSYYVYTCTYTCAEIKGLELLSCWMVTMRQMGGGSHSTPDPSPPPGHVYPHSMVHHVNKRCNQLLPQGWPHVCWECTGCYGYTLLPCTYHTLSTVWCWFPLNMAVPVDGGA